MADPIVEELQLDIAPALESLTPLGTALADLSLGFASGLSDALDTAFGQPIPGDQLIDTVPLTSAVETALGDAAAQPLPIEGDTSALNASLADALDAPREIPLDGDAGPLAAAIESATEPQTVSVDADVTAAQNAIDELVATPVDVQVDADTSAAQESIDALGSSASAASGGVDSLTGGVEALKGVTGVASGSVEALGGIIANINPEAAGATAAMVAFGAFVGETATLAGDAQAQNRRFAETFGVLADRVREIDVGGLTLSLAELGKRSGTTNADLEATASRLGQLGKSAGASGPEIVDTTTKILALGATVAVNNPRLGDAAEVADRLGNAFIRGGKALTPFSISLSKAQIEAEALKETGKQTAAELTIYERVVAGANLATAQFGESLGTKFQEGSQNAQVQLRALKVELEEMLVAVGGPLLDPVVASLQELLPVAREAGIALGLLAQDIAPAIAVLGPALAPVAGALGLISDGLRAIGDAEKNISPEELVIIGGAITGIAFASGGATVAVTALGAALGALAANPIVLAIAAIGLLGLAYERTHQSSERAKVDTQELDKAFGQFGAGTDSATANLATLNGAIDDYLKKQLQVGPASRTGLDGAVQLGLGYDDLTKALGGTNAQFIEFNNRLGIDAKAATTDQLAANVALKETLLQGRDALQAKSQAEIEAAVASGSLTQHQVELAQATSDGTTIEIDRTFTTHDYITALKALAPEIERANIAQNAAAEIASRTSPAYAEIARQLALGSVGAQTAQAALEKLGFTSDAAAGQVKALNSQIDSFVNAAVSALPGPGAAITAFNQQVSDDFKKVSESVASGSSSIAADLKRLADDQDPQRFADNLNQQAAQIAGFQANLSKLVEEGFGALAATLAQKGPETAGALAAAFGSDESKAKVASGSLALASAATSSFDKFLRAHFPELEGLGAAAGTHVNEGLGSALDLQGPTRKELESAQRTIRDHQAALANAARAAAGGATEAVRAGLDLHGPTTKEVTAARDILRRADGVKGAAAGAGKGATDEYGNKLGLPDKTTKSMAAAADVFGGQGRINLANQAGNAGLLVGSAFDHGLARGINENTGSIESAAATAAGRAEAAAKQRLGVKSPSAVAHTIGQQFTQGFAAGISADFPLVDRAATDLTDLLTSSLGDAHLAALDITIPPVAMELDVEPVVGPIPAQVADLELRPRVGTIAPIPPLRADVAVRPVVEALPALATTAVVHPTVDPLPRLTGTADVRLTVGALPNLALDAVVRPIVPPIPPLAVVGNVAPVVPELDPVTLDAAVRPIVPKLAPVPLTANVHPAVPALQDVSLVARVRPLMAPLPTQTLDVNVRPALDIAPATLTHATSALGAAATKALTAGFHDPATVAAAQARLDALIEADNRAAAAAKALADAGQSAEQKAAAALAAFNAFVSGAVGQLPGTGAAISAFASNFTSALNKSAEASRLAHIAWLRYQHDLKVHADTKTIFIDADAWKKASHTFDLAQGALAAMSNPTKFIASLKAQTASLKAFQADLTVILAAGNNDVADALAKAGPEVAGALAHALALSPTKAKLAEFAIDNGQAYSDAFSTFLETQFKDDFATAAADAGKTAGQTIAVQVANSLNADKSAAAAAAGLSKQITGAFPDAIALPVTLTPTIAAAGSFANTAPVVATPAASTSTGPTNIEVQVVVNMEDGTVRTPEPVLFTVQPSKLLQRVKAEVSAQ